MKNLPRSLILLLSTAFALSSCGLMENPKEDISEGDSSSLFEERDSSSDIPSPSLEESGQDSTEDSADESNFESLLSEESEEGSAVEEESDSSFPLDSISSSTSEEKDEESHDFIGIEKTPWAKLNFNQYGASFRDALASLINASGSRTCSYNDLKSVLSYSDASSHSGAIVPFYHDSSEYTNKWNREHVWPDSRGVGTSGPGSDPQMIRPTLTADNNSRGNLFFGVNAANTWDPASFKYEPARGEAARIIFYTATRYGKSNGLSLSNNPQDRTDMKTMGVLRNLVEWNHQYPVTEMEIKRNDILHDNGFARNPFIDYPSLADYIWDSEGLRTTALDGSLDPDAMKYSLITDMTELSEGKEVVIVSEAADATGSFASLSSELYNQYYLSAEPGRKEGSFFYPTLSSTKWKIHIDGKTLQFSHENLVLGVSINGTHKNLVAQKGLSANIDWSLVSMNESSGLSSLKNIGTSTYIEYYKGDFSSYGQDKGVYFFA